ncbi:uncharacterized protein AC631_05003 [Debaryomyces fabryi]|uniref:Uncharacterized protein n=1 Tax=Debaryomyces fabryi TaxID=58627 RepID=A0A0V1PSM4_9ASCO|nr:uncharacterized protein AC631_05003 [Debaryomyces fabryi]KRZ99235.1 hypothetical protein AC631_05003 [Debaryomyces fabryi]CUM55713.1 unnamed protein product [Debaryomyces fabryi]
MGDYIPDSEDEEDLLLLPGVISHLKVAQTLQSMPEPTRQVISSELRRTRFFELVPEMTPESLREAYTFTVNDLGDSRQHSTTGDRSTHTEEEGDGIRHNSDQIDNGDLGKIRHDLDRDDIEMLQESSINQSSRRGLRKRNFASTHPYIADQAHWLGLSSINSLNELYHETPDLDAIVRLLNQIYLKKKSRYSSDEKYKAKNFYAFLGKRPGFIKDQELSSQFTEDSSQPSFPKETNNRTESNENNISNDSDLGESDSSILFLNRKNHSIIVDDEDEEPADAHVLMDDPLSTDESEDSDIMVRVGGKFRKERNVLRGTLPESAKRLDLYRSKKSKIDRKKRNNNNYRKGLAIKKSNVSNNRDNILENELMSFVDDNDYYEEPPAFYHNFEPLEYQNDLLLMDTDNADSDESINVFSDISESSNTGIYDDYNSKSFEGDIDNTDFQKIQNGVNEDLRTDYYGGVHLLSKYDDDSDSVIEDNRVDPQFVYPSITRNHKVTGNKRKTNKKSRNAAQTLDKWNPTAVTGNAKRQMSNGSGTGIRKQKLNKRQTKIVGLSSKGFDKVSFGKLRKKRIGSSDKEMNNKKKGYSKVANVIDTSMNPKKSQKDMLITDYYFLRTPNISTTIFEAESTNRFVKTKDTRFSYNQRGILPSHLQYAEKSDKLYEDEISNTIIFDDIDMNKIHSLKFGVCPICNTDSSVIILMGEKYSFTLIDKTDSNVRSEMLLLQLAKLLNDLKIYSNEDLNKEIQQSLKGIIKWFLILQENPSENAWTYLLHILDDMSKVKKKDNISSKLSFFPYFLLLYYIFIQVSQRDILDKQTIELRYTDYNRYCVKYWTLYFQFTDIDSLTNDELLLLNFQSLHFMYLLFQNNDEIWWPVINKALNRLISLRLAPMGIFDMLYYIASLIPPSRCNWSSFYIIYNAHKSDDNSDFHNRFIETIYSLNEKYSWTFEEKLITTIYSTITARKFSNFDDEKTGPELIDILITRDSIPNTSFFEKFMHLLYCYVSSLPYGGNKKRLISKLFTSSHYHYQKGSRSFAMFVNRFNFILLLSQLSDVDLRNQVLDLVQQVKSSNDIKMYNITNEGLQTYSNIAASKSKSLPVDSYQIMVETMIDLYTSLPGIQRIWEQLLINIEKYFLPDINSTFAFNNHFNFFALVRRLEFNKFTDLISVSLVKLLLKAVTNIIKAEQFNISEKNSELIYIVQEKYFSFLHTHMGRFPFLNQLTEDRTTEIIEESIRVWIRCNSLLKEVNWNVLVLQKYPYIGNSYLRERFVLFFYNELLLFTSLSNHIDSIILALLKSLALFFTSPYLALIINLLMKSHHRLFIFKKEHVPEQLTSFQMLNYKLLIASNIIFNLAEDDILSKATKIIYLEELIKSLNEEYNKYFESTSYVEYCRKLVETVQKYCAEFIQSIDEYGSLSRKLGIKHLESNEYRWHILPLKEKLTCLNNEISSAVFFQKDARSILDEYITLESFDLVYHLISIYMKSVTNFQQDKWIFISQLMEYIYSKLLDYKILISDKLYKNFLRLLVDLGSLRRKVEGRFHLYEVYQNKSFIAAFAIFRETYYLYDGYKDRAQIKSTINDFVDMYDDSNTDNYITDLSIPFSSYVLFDIQQPGSEIGGSTVQNTPQDNLNKLKESSDHGYNQLLKIIRPTLSSEFLSTSLPFDISF